MNGMSNQISSWAGGASTVTLGALQYLLGKRSDKKNKRPAYEIPAEVSQNLNQAQQMALQGLPEEQKQQYLQNVQRSAAFGLNQIGSRKGGLAGVAALNQMQNDAYGNLLTADSAQVMQNKGVLMNQRQNMADYRDQAFQLNSLNPYYETKAKDQAMMGAGMQNVSQGFQASNSSYDFGGGGGSNNPYQANPYAQSLQPFKLQNQGMTNPYAQGNTPAGLTNPYRVDNTPAGLTNPYR